MFRGRYAITFGEVSILHVGGKKFGSVSRAEHGFSVGELRAIHENTPNSELVAISDVLPEELRTEKNEAAVLVIRNGTLPWLQRTHADALLKEQQQQVDYDRRYFDTRRQRTLCKRARYNVVFGETAVEHSDDYRQCTVKAFSSLPCLNSVRKGIGELLGEKAVELQAEGNHYYEKKSGIGFHGDSERKIVVCLSVGDSTTLCYHWRMPHSSEHRCEAVNIEVRHGDLYVMSEKATGYDWRQRSLVRVVHAAGSQKYTGEQQESAEKKRKTNSLEKSPNKNVAQVVKLRRRKTGEIVQDCDVYIGRRMTMGGWNLPQSKWHNPFSVKKDCGGSAAVAVQKYEEWIRHGDGQCLLKELEELRGKVLGCWCKRKPSDACHGDVLVRLLRERGTEKKRAKTLN